MNTQAAQPSIATDPSTAKTYEFRVYGEPMQYRTPDTRILTDRNGRLIPCWRTGKPWTLIQHPDSRVVKWEKEVAAQIRGQLTSEFDPILVDCPVYMELWIFITRPKSNKSMYPHKQPDRTNFLKSSEDGVEPGLRHDIETDIRGKVIKTFGFNDAQVVSGPVELRWAYFNYPECGRQKPGLIVKLREIDTSREKELNADYRRYIKQQGLEYVAEYYGRKKDKKRIVLKKVW